MERFILAILTGIALDIDAHNEAYLRWLHTREGECSTKIDLYHQPREDVHIVPARRAFAAHAYLGALTEYAKAS